MVERGIACLEVLIILFFVLQSPRATRGALSSLITLRIGTRPSPLARKQAQIVADALKEAHPKIDTEFVILDSTSEHKVTVDVAIQDKPLALTSNVDFTSTIDKAIMNGQVDIGVHSLKDVPPYDKWCGAELLKVACYLPRACPLDVLIGDAESLDALPQGARVGSASTRRQSQLLSIRPDLQLINLRGNVQVRLLHLQNGLVDALVMARSGLDRLKQDVTLGSATTLSSDTIMPAPGQGIVGVVCRKDDLETIQLLQSINDEEACIAATAELQVLNTVDANIAKPFTGRPPLAAFMEHMDGKQWVLRARLLRPDGKCVLEVERHLFSCNKDEARIVGQDVGNELVKKAGKAFFG